MEFNGVETPLIGTAISEAIDTVPGATRFVPRTTRAVSRKINDAQSYFD